MSQYTTGEIAKLCSVTVRTVQYYDGCGILVPSELSEGGRRLYSEDDLKRMKLICFLRELDLSINTIRQLLEEDHPEKVIDLLLQQQEVGLKEEIRQRKEKLAKLEELQKSLKSFDNFSIESIHDIANMMENKKKLKKMRWTMLIVALIGEAIEVGMAMFWVLEGIWWPFACIGLPVVILLSIWISLYYYKCTAYICPQCHQVLKPTFKAMFGGAHTLTTRKLKCPCCGHKGYCVETYRQT